MFANYEERREWRAMLRREDKEAIEAAKAVYADGYKAMAREILRELNYPITDPVIQTRILTGLS